MSSKVTKYREIIKRKADWEVEIDLRNEGWILGKVKDQKGKNACWAIQVADALTDHVTLMDGPPRIELSSQELVDCLDVKQPDMYMVNDLGLAFEYVKSNGLGLEREYGEYEGVKKKCKSLSVSQKKLFTGMKYTEVWDENNVVTSLSQKNSVLGVIKLWLSFCNWFGTEEFYPGPSERDEKMEECHLVKIVGCGIETSVDKPFWLIQNSWDAAWGDKGFAKVTREIFTSYFIIQLKDSKAEKKQTRGKEKAAAKKQTPGKKKK